MISSADDRPLTQRPRPTGISSCGLLLTALLSLGLPACAGESPDPDRAGPGTDARTDPRTGSSDGAPGDETRPICLQGDAFAASGEILDADQVNGDARQLSAMRWERHDGCERFVIDLATAEGDPATAAGPVRAELLRELGVVRVHLRGVETVDADATEAVFDGPLTSAAFAVWAPEGRWVYVDLHLDRPAEAHVHHLADPARAVVDLRPGGPDLPDPATRGRRVVVLTPRPGEASYPLVVTGYARTFEANVVARLVQSDEVVRDTFTTATAWADAWGHYTLTLPDGPTGAVQLQVGEHSARDGTWEGESVDLVLR